MIGFLLQFSAPAARKTANNSINTLLPQAKPGSTEQLPIIIRNVLIAVKMLSTDGTFQLYRFSGAVEILYLFRPPVFLPAAARYDWISFAVFRAFGVENCK